MIKGIRVKTFIVLAVIIFVAVGCNKVRYVVPITLVEVKPSFVHTLEVMNETQNTVTLIPPEDSDALPLAISPGISKEIKFVVIRVAEKDQNGDPIPVSFTEMVADSEGYVGMENNEGLLQISISEDEVWGYLISLRDCWSKKPQTDKTNIKVNQEPGLNPEVRLCE